MNVSLVDEVRGADFGDERLGKRLMKVVHELGGKPNDSIPGATYSRAEMEAAYRLFANPKVSPDKILAPHFAATRDRIAQCDFVLLVQDTTELDVTRPQQQVAGAGPMDSESRRGAFVHPLMAFGLDKVPLGMVWQKTWTREKLETTSRSERSKKRRLTPIEQKESIRWIEGIRAAREVAEACPDTTCVCVADSEADIYEVFSEPRRTAAGELHLLIRTCQKRSTDDKSNWLSQVRATEALYECTVQISSRLPKIGQGKSKREQARDARNATVEVRATQVTLTPPPRPDRKLSPVSLNLVLVEEPNPPAGTEPIQWLLATTLPIDDPEQVRKIVECYCCRWQIEVYFRTLKSGCRIEARYFGHLGRLLNCHAVYSLVAWRIMYLCYFGRECPDLDCEVIFEPSEWKSVYMAVRRQDPPAKPPRLNEMIRMIASLGGYVIRRATHPGTQTLWLGLQRVHDFSTAWTAFGPDD